MQGWVVKRDRLIQLPSAGRDVPGKQQGSSEEAMPNHNWGGRSLLLRHRQELRREIAHSVAIEGYKV